MTLSDQQLARVDFLLYEGDDETAFAEMLAQVESSEELHLYARQINWDGGYDKLTAVLNHPLCDRGTALMIYWHSEPLFFTEFATAAEVSDVHRPLHTFVKQVESLLLSGRFSHNTISFDPLANLNVVQRRRVQNNARIPEVLKHANC